jgi:hypothetical protein
MKQILAFLLFSLLLVWFMFAPVYKHVLILRQAVLQKEADYMLEVGAGGRFGFIDAAMVNESRQRLEEVGFDPALLEYTISTTDGAAGTDPGNPVTRGTGIRLHITYPYGNLFGIDRLLGIAGPDSQERMGAAGMKMSEYVP